MGWEKTSTNKQSLARYPKEWVFNPMISTSIVMIVISIHFIALHADWWMTQESCSLTSKFSKGHRCDISNMPSAGLWTWRTLGRLLWFEMACARKFLFGFYKNVCQRERDAKKPEKFIVPLWHTVWLLQKFDFTKVSISRESLKHLPVSHPMISHDTLWCHQTWLAGKSSN